MGEVIEFREALDRIAERVSVDDRLTEIVSHSPVLRSGTKSLHVDTDHLDPEVRLVPMKEIDVSLNATSETSNRRRLLMAAAAVVAVIGVAGIALAISSTNTDDDKTPSPAAVATVAPTTSVATTSVAPTTVAPAMETVRFAATGANIPVTFTVPDDWTVTEGLEEGWTAYKGVGIGEVGLNFNEIPNIYADGCQWERLDPPVGPTVNDLAEAWANVPDLAATAAVDVTVDGYAGKQIEFTVPDYNSSECRGADSPVFALWTSPYDAFPFGAQGPNQHTEQRILDVDGTRLVITTYEVPSSSPQDRAALDEVLASIQIG